MVELFVVNDAAMVARHGGDVAKATAASAATVAAVRSIYAKTTLNRAIQIVLVGRKMTDY